MEINLQCNATLKTYNPDPILASPVITASWSCRSAEFYMLLDCGGLFHTIATPSNHTGLHCFLYLEHRRHEFEVRDPQFLIRLSSSSLPFLRHCLLPCLEAHAARPPPCNVLPTFCVIKTHWPLHVCVSPL
jgi:hypothetical protein